MADTKQNPCLKCKYYNKNSFYCIFCNRNPHFTDNYLGKDEKDKK